MALRRGPSRPATGPRPVRLGLTAAGRELDLASEATVKQFRSRPFPWQKTAYQLYDEVGECWFAGQYVASAMSRLRIFPAIQPDPDADPIAIDSDKLEAKDRPPDEEIAILLALTERLTNSFGGIGDIMRGHALNNFLAGESFLIGRLIDETEEWEVHSVLALTVDETGRAVGLKRSPDDKPGDIEKLWFGENDQKNAMVVHVWRRHPAWPNFPDAPMRPGISYLEDLRILTASIRAAAQSRIPSGIFGIPSESLPEGYEPTDENAEGEAKKDPLIEQLLTHLSTPILNPKDASALVPFIMSLPGDELEKIRQFDFAREIDKLAVELRTESRQSFATTVDLPADVLSGKQDLNHWTAWNIDEDGFKIHLASHAELIMDGLTAGYMWPSIQGEGGEGGVERPRRYRFWYDATELVSHPNRFDNALKAHAVFAISDGTLRDSGGFDDNDAPDDPEVQRRIVIAQATRPTGPALPAGAETVLPGPPAIEAASTPRAIRGAVPLGQQLALIERGLISRLLVAADAEMRRVLERVGNRVITAAKRRHNPRIDDLLRVTGTAEIPARLGRDETLELLGASSDTAAMATVGNEAFDGLHTRFETWIAQAQHQGLRAVERVGSALDPDVRDHHLSRMASDREAAWPLWHDALTAIAAERVFGVVAAPVGAQLGELDASSSIPAGSLRAVLKRAGGGEFLVEPTVESGVRTSLLSGDAFMELFASAKVTRGEWIWIYGDPSSRSVPFEPHEELDFVTFSTWDADVLTNNEPWPPVDFYYPGDHDTCQCTYAIDGGPVPEDA